MNENEKIELLQSIKEAVKEVIVPLEEKMDSLENKVDSMEKRIDYIETDVKDTKYDVKDMHIELRTVSYDVRKIKLIVENELRPDIRTLAEGNKSRVEKDNELEKRMDELEVDIIDLKVINRFPDIQKAAK